MKQTKKMLALLLAVLMLCGLPFAVHAEDTATTGGSGAITLDGVRVMEHYSTYIIVQLQFSDPIHIVPGTIYLCNAYNTKGCGGGNNEGHWQFSAGQEKYFTYVGTDTEEIEGVKYSSVVNVSFNKCTHEKHTPLWLNENGCQSLPSSAVIRIVESGAVGGDGVLDTSCAYGPNGEKLAATVKSSATSDITYLDVEDFATIEKATFAGKTENADGSFAYAVNLTFSDYVRVKDPTNFFLDTTDKLTGSGVKATSAQAVSPSSINGVDYSKTVKMNFTVTASQMNQLNASINAGSKLAVMIGEWNNTTLGYSTNRTNGQSDAHICADQYGRGIKLAFKAGSCESSYAEVNETSIISAVYVGREVSRFLVDVTFSEPIKINNRSDVIMRAAVEIPGVSDDPTAPNYRCPLSSFTYLNDDDNDGYATRVRLYFDSKQGQIIPEWPIGSMVVGFYEYNNADKNGYVSTQTVAGLAEAPVVANYASTKMDAAYCTLEKVEASIGNTYFSKVELALAEAKEDETVRLEANADVTDLEFLEVGSGVALDLNGKTLDVTGKGLAALNATVVDGDGKTGTGLLKAAKDEVFLNQGNTQLPLYDAANDGYRFYEYQFMGKIRDDAPTNAWRYAVRLALPTEEAYALLAQDANQDMVGVDLQLLNADGTENNKVPCKFASKTMSEYADKSQDLTAKKAIVFTVYGKDAVDAKGLTLESAPSLSSITGVQLTPDWLE